MQRSKAFFNLDLEGFEAIERKLNQMAERPRRRILRNALRAGVKVVQDEAIQLAPKGRPPKGWMAFLDAEEYSNHTPLHKGIVTKVSVTAQRAWGRVGIDFKKVHHGHIMEFGAKPHLARFRGIIFNHPGIRPRPFMRPAFERKGEAAMMLMGNILYQEVIGGL